MPFELGECFAMYKCKICGVEFEAIAPSAYLASTGHRVAHCNLTCKVLKSYRMAMDGPVELR